MRVKLDRDADAVYIYFKEIGKGEVDKTICLNDSISIDLDSEGRTLGIEIVDASRNLPVSAFKESVVA